MELRRVAPVVGLVALLLVDGALIAWAVRPLPAEVAETVSTAGPTASPTAASASRSASPSSSPSSSSSPKTLATKPLTVVAGAADGDVVWVADSGTCERPGTVWVSPDGGDSWTSYDAPGRVLRVKPDTGSLPFVTGGDVDCNLQLWSTLDGGASWSVASAENAWSRDPGDAAAVHLPNGTTAAPCPDGSKVADVAPSNASVAFVLCDDRMVRTTGDGGSTWTDVAEVDGALALALAPDSSAALVVRSDPGCVGFVPAVVRDGKISEGKCVKAKLPDAGEVAAATNGSKWWVVLGDKVFRATKPEGTWKATGASLGS